MRNPEDISDEQSGAANTDYQKIFDEAQNVVRPLPKLLAETIDTDATVKAYDQAGPGQWPERPENRPDYTTNPASAEYVELALEMYRMSRDESDNTPDNEMTWDDIGDDSELAIKNMLRIAASQGEKAAGGGKAEKPVYVHKYMRALKAQISESQMVSDLQAKGYEHLDNLWGEDSEHTLQDMIDKLTQERRTNPQGGQAERQQELRTLLRLRQELGENPMDSISVANNYLVEIESKHPEDADETWGRRMEDETLLNNLLAKYGPDLVRADPHNEVARSKEALEGLNPHT